MFIICSDFDPSSATHQEATLRFLRSPAMLVEEQGPVQEHQITFAPVADPGDADAAWTWELSADAPRIGDVDDDPPQNFGVVLHFAAASAYVVVVDSGERDPVSELVASGPRP